MLAFLLLQESIHLPETSKSEATRVRDAQGERTCLITGGLLGKPVGTGFERFCLIQEIFYNFFQISNDFFMIPLFPKSTRRLVRFYYLYVLG